MSELKYWLWLATRPGVGAQTVGQVLDRFGSPRQAWLAAPEELVGLPDRLVQALADRSLDRAERVLADCERLGYRIMTIEDADYPRRLRAIADPPRVLYIWGRLPAVDERALIGVVGTRKATGYGRRAADYLGQQLTAGGAVVVSGLAAGIDTCALEGALRAGGTPVAVVGGGLDRPYPSQNAHLYRAIAAVGAVVSEYPPGADNSSYHFPVRNRIISGLSVGTVVVESDGGGGSMITAGLVEKQGRDLYAVPGPMDARFSRGCNGLIAKGARAVSQAADVLAPYADRYGTRPRDTRPMGDRPQPEPPRWEPERPAAPIPTPPKGQPVTMDTIGKKPLLIQRGAAGDEQRAVLEAMGDELCTADQLAQKLGTDSRKLQGTLTLLAINGLVQEMPGKRFVRLDG